MRRELGEGAVDLAAGADALDDLLAEVAALGEVECVGLGGLLREVFGGFGVADVLAVFGGGSEDAVGFEGFGAQENSSQRLAFTDAASGLSLLQTKARGECDRREGGARSITRSPRGA